MRQEVQKIKDQEKKVAGDQRRKRSKRGVLPNNQKFDIDDQYNIPVGTPFDYILKERAEKIDQ